MATVKVIAHRTCPLDAPENSLRGIDRAREMGADAVEVDVRVTRDGIPVLLHDRTGWRTAGRPMPVKWVAHRRVSRFTVRGSATRLPTLRHALDALPAGLDVAIDVKDHRDVEATARVVRATGVEAQAMLWVRDAQGVRVAARLLPGARTALLRNTYDERSSLRYVADAHDCGADQISLHQRGVTRRVVDSARSVGIEVLAWVVERRGHEAVLAAGVDGVVTDWPLLARSLLAP